MQMLWAAFAFLLGCLCSAVRSVLVSPAIKAVDASEEHQKMLDACAEQLTDCASDDQDCDAHDTVAQHGSCMLRQASSNVQARCVSSSNLPVETTKRAWLNYDCVASIDVGTDHGAGHLAKSERCKQGLQSPWSSCHLPRCSAYGHVCKLVRKHSMHAGSQPLWMALLRPQASKATSGGAAAGACGVLASLARL